jgi:hypothetical protein
MSLDGVGGRSVNWEEAANGREDDLSAVIPRMEQQLCRNQRNRIEHVGASWQLICSWVLEETS